MPALSKSRSAAYLFLILNTALWGFASPIIKHSLGFTSPALFLLYRYIIASLIFFPIFLVHRSRSPRKMNLKHLVVLALLGTPLTLLPLFYGLKITTSIEASLLVSSSPIFTVLGGLIYLNEKLTKKEWRGIIIAVLGTLILTLEPLFSGQGGLGALSLKGNLLIVISNIIWAFFLIFSKKDHVDPISLTFVSFVISIPFFLLISLLEHTGITMSSQALPGVFYMAIGGSIIAFWAYQEGQKRIEASEAAIFTYLQPAFSIPLSLLWLKEPFTPVTVLATAIIISGVYLSEKR
jgi:drug/metabolite transporter (DMT)-like permease